MSLNEVAIGQQAIIKEVLAAGLLKERLMALGFTKGLKINVIRKGPKNHLTVFNVRGVMICLRSDESKLIIVV